MARKPRDYDADISSLIEKTKQARMGKTIQLGEIVQVVGADTLSPAALAGALPTAVKEAKEHPEAVARWTKQGQTFQTSRKRGAKAAAGDGAHGTPDNDGEPSASDRAGE